MYIHPRFTKSVIIAALMLLSILKANAQGADNIIAANENSFGLWIMALHIIIPLLMVFILDASKDGIIKRPVY